MKQSCTHKYSTQQQEQRRDQAIFKSKGELICVESCICKTTISMTNAYELNHTKRNKNH